MSAQGTHHYLNDQVFDHLDSDVCLERTRLAKESLLTGAAREYAQMFSAEAVSQYFVGGVYVGTDKQRLGLASLDKRGNVVIMVLVWFICRLDWSCGCNVAALI